MARGQAFARHRDSTPDGYTATASPVTFIGLATLSQTGAAFAQQGIPVLGVFLAAAYHLSLTQMGIVVSAVFLGMMLASIGSGLLVDAFGSRRVLLVSSTLLGLVASALHWATTVTSLYVCLLLLGVLLATISPAGSKAVLAAWQSRGRGLPMGIRQTGVPLGAMAAAFLLPRMADTVGLPVIFWSFAAVLLVVGWAFASVLPPFVRAATSKARAPLRRAELTGLAMPTLCSFLMGWSQYDLVTYSIPALHRNNDISIVAAGVLLAISQLGGALARVGLGALSDRLGGRREPILVLVAGFATLLAVVLAFLPRGLPFAVLAILWFCLGVGMVGWNALMLTWTGEHLPIARAGLALSVGATAVMAGAVVAPPVFGWVVESTGHYRPAWLLLAVVLALATILLARATRTAAYRSEAH